MSNLQDVFLHNLVETIRAARQRLNTRIGFLPDHERAEVDRLLWEELRTVVHSFLCELDGSTNLADYGSIRVVDDNGNEFVRFLHEIVFDELSEEEL